MKQKSTYTGLLLTALSAFCCLITLLSFPQDARADGASRYVELRRETRMKLEALCHATARAEETGIGVEREFVTITTAELFLSYADWDAAHPAELEATIASWWRVKKDAPRLAKELPNKELSDLIVVLDAARKELDDVVSGRFDRRPSIVLDMTVLEERDGYYYQNGRPVFPSAFCWQPYDEKLSRAFGHIDSHYLSPSAVRAEGQKPLVNYDFLEHERLGYLFFGQNQMPKWLIEKHPDILDGEHYFTGFDTDHPAARRLWADLLAEVVPRVAGRRVSQAGYLLTNEPHWYTCTDCWATGPVSAKTKAKFRDWLKQRHRTIDALNVLWRTDFASFAEVTIDVPIDSALRGKPIWYDWCRFNMDRITDWFGFLKQEIQRHDPEAKPHIKLIPGMFAGGSRCHGLDFEALVRLQGIIGCDAGCVTTPHWKEAESWPDRYACKWRDQALPLDFFRSISPNKLLFDSEWHSLSKANLRDPNMPAEYVRCALWLAHLHGTGMNKTWYWSREMDGAARKKSESGFYASSHMQPLVLDAYGRTMKELNAFAAEIVALATQPKRVRIFYSEASAIQDAGYMDRLFQVYQALYHCGMPIGFVTEGILGEAGDKARKQWPIIIVPNADHVTAGERKALEQYMANGGNLLVLGNNSLMQDEYGRSSSSLKTEKGRLLQLDEADSDVLCDHLRQAGLAPPIELSESNDVGLPGCVWRTAASKSGYNLLILNLGKGKASIRLNRTVGCRDLISGKQCPGCFTMKPFDVKLLHLPKNDGTERETHRTVTPT